MRCAMDSPRVEFERIKARAHHGRVSRTDSESCAHHLPRVAFSFVNSSIPRTVVYWTTCRHIRFQDFYLKKDFEGHLIFYKAFVGSLGGGGVLPSLIKGGWVGVGWGGVGRGGGSAAPI
jgi:hypothetical protein